MRDKGLGDTVARFTEATGIKKTNRKYNARLWLQK